MLAKHDTNKDSVVTEEEWISGSPIVGAEMPRQARHDIKRSGIVILSLSKDLRSGFKRENWGMSNKTLALTWRALPVRYSL